MEGQCEGKTRDGERCKVHRSSPYAVAAPLRRGERFCGHHHPNKYTGVRCVGIKKHSKGQCRVWSGSCYADAAPLRRGSPYCHHHRVRCAGVTETGVRCTVTSSSEHTHADPLRRGKQYCAHHQGADGAEDTGADHTYDHECQGLGSNAGEEPLQVAPRAQDSDSESVSDTFSMVLGAHEEAELFSDDESDSESVSSVDSEDSRGSYRGF